MALLSRFVHTSSIEPLEARIAPALLINGANLLVANSANDSGETSVGDNSVQVVKVTSGQAIVWFQDGSILGVSFGPNTSMEIAGHVEGDIIGNLTASGRLSDSDNNAANGEDGGVLLSNDLTGLTIRPLVGEDGNVGHIITGGSVSNVRIEGVINGIYAGDGAFHNSSNVLVGTSVLSTLGGAFGGFDFNPVQPGNQFEFNMSLAKAQGAGLQAGASVQDIQIAKASELQIFAGGGNPNNLPAGIKTGAAGGSIRGVVIDTAYVEAGSSLPVTPPSYHLRAGDGADGKTGGAGGGIERVIETTSSGKVIIEAGHGGNGLSGAGGAGGSVANLDLQSDSSQYEVTAGAGGSGAPGGAGGNLKDNNFANRAPIGGVVVAADFTGDGLDDVLVADQSTGGMVLSKNVGDGRSFTKVAQYSDVTGEIFIIDGKGQTPSDATAVDFDKDGDLDLLVAYKNSNSLAVYFNQGAGSFWDQGLNEGEGDFAGVSVGLALSPSRIALMDAAGLRVAVGGLSEGRGAVQLLAKTAGDDGPTLEGVAGLTTFKLPIADLVGSRVTGALFVAGGDGKIQQLVPSGLETQPFNVIETGVSIQGGIADLDIDTAGNRLVALGSTAKAASVYEILSANGDGALSIPALINFSASQGKPLAVKFVDDQIPTTPDRIAVLSSLPGGARVDLFYPLLADNDPTTPDALGYSLNRSINTSQTLKTIVPAYSETGPASFAGLASSLSQFSFGDDFLTISDYSLPFADKQVIASAGAGGAGLDLAGKIGRGGNGGDISGLNANAHIIQLTGGAGGDSQTGAAGSGGSVFGAGNFQSASGGSIAPKLSSDAQVTILGGAGGSVSAAGAKTASGGSGGSVRSLGIEFSDPGSSADVENPGVTIEGGAGGIGRGGNGGSGGSVDGIVTLARGGSLRAVGGLGGDALAGSSGTSGAGGGGGSVVGIDYTTQLAADAEVNESARLVLLEAGAGGTSVSQAGGAGGSVTGTTLSLDAPNRTYNDPNAEPPVVDAKRDSTVATSIIAGAGGNGARGGFGGTIRDFSYNATFDQLTRFGGLILNYYTLDLHAGNGGLGSAGNGGDGGSIVLSRPISGVTSFDPEAETPVDNPERIPLVVTAGLGGNGSINGGAGGSISGLIAENSIVLESSVAKTTLLVSAKVLAGDGGAGGIGDGGRGGSISKSLLGVQSDILDFNASILKQEGGFIQVAAGDGGSGGGKGGAGGGVNTSEFGVVSTAVNLGMLITAGDGGLGVNGGGAGGGISTLRLNTSQSTDVPSALIIAGNGGDANSSRALAGNGGSIAGITQAKDVNSSINLIQAGNGGDNPQGKAGNGGSVSKVQTVGFIGRPSNGDTPLGVFDVLITDQGGVEIPAGLFHDNADGTATFAQGMFVGRGGNGVTPGANGSVNSVVARQIAAISAAMDPATQLFEAVAKITKLKADLVGYDADRGSLTVDDGTYDDILGGSTRPDGVIPRDGFLFPGTPLAGTVSILTSRPTFIFG